MVCLSWELASYKLTGSEVTRLKELKCNCLFYWSYQILHCTSKRIGYVGVKCHPLILAGVWLDQLIYTMLIANLYIYPYFNFFKLMMTALKSLAKHDFPRKISEKLNIFCCHVVPKVFNFSFFRLTKHLNGYP